MKTIQRRLSYLEKREREHRASFLYRQEAEAMMGRILEVIKPLVSTHVLTTTSADLNTALSSTLIGGILDQHAGLRWVLQAQKAIRKNCDEITCRLISNRLKKG